MNEHKKDRNESRYNFFLNPYKDRNFSKCPKCGNRTYVKKFVLVVLFENPQMVFNMGKYCRFCAHCELIIANKEEMKYPVEFLGRDVEKMSVYGTLNIEEWKEIQRRRVDSPDEIIKKAYPFKKV